MQQIIQRPAMQISPKRLEKLATIANFAFSAAYGFLDGYNRTQGLEFNLEEPYRATAMCAIWAEMAAHLNNTYRSNLTAKQKNARYVAGFFFPPLVVSPLGVIAGEFLGNIVGTYSSRYG